MTRSNDSIRQPVANSLTARQRAELRSLAHHLKPILHIGKEGVAEATVSAAIEAFSTREIMKIRVLENAPVGVRDSAEALSQQIGGAHVVQVIGRTVVLYRRDPHHPKIELGG